jgi:diguanylate cyclase (GGDEF)-like protein
MAPVAELTGLPSDLSDRPAGERTRTAAFNFVIATCIAALASTAFDGWSVLLPTFVPVVAAMWASAELLTAFLLLSQFLVNGVRLLLVLGAAYAFTGLLAIPYLVRFPGALGGHPSAVAPQVSLSLWSIWHLAFPAVVAAGIVLDRGTGARVLDRARMRRDCIIVLAVVTIACIGSSAAVFLLRGSLPILFSHGRFTPLFEFAIVPTVILANAAVMVLVAVQTPLTALDVWLAVALAIAAIDATLNTYAGGRYSPSWYVGKLLTLTTASVVLVALLGEVSALYRRVGALAMNDSLTGLLNRSTFDDCTAWTFSLLRRQHGEVAMLMIDVDFFKSYNDRYGHPAGDACLRRVGAALSQTLRRGDDVVARYGGEEFVALLPLASLQSATDLAERLRLAVLALAIPHAGGVAGLGVVTISIGVGYTHDVTADDPTALLAVADRALYAAKERRNLVVVETRGPRDALASA